MITKFNPGDEVVSRHFQSVFLLDEYRKKMENYKKNHPEMSLQKLGFSKWKVLQTKQTVAGIYNIIMCEVQLIEGPDNFYLHEREWVPEFDLIKAPDFNLCNVGNFINFALKDSNLFFLGNSENHPDIINRISKVPYNWEFRVFSNGSFDKNGDAYVVFGVDKAWACPHFKVWLLSPDDRDNCLTILQYSNDENLSKEEMLIEAFNKTFFNIPIWQYLGLPKSAWEKK